MSNDDRIDIDYEEDFGETQRTPQMGEDDLATVVGQQVLRFNSAMKQLGHLPDQVVATNFRFHRAMTDRQASAIKHHVKVLLKKLQSSWGIFQCTYLKDSEVAGELMWGQAEKTLTQLTEVEVHRSDDLMVYIANHEAIEALMVEVCELLDCDQENLQSRVENLCETEKMVAEMCQMAGCDQRNLK